MQGIGLVSHKNEWIAIALLALVTGCTAPAQEGRSLHIQQDWQLKTGDTIAGHTIAGSLGDVSIELGGNTIYAPFDGKVQRNDIPNCYIYSSPEVPAYLFRLCGLHSVKVGTVQQGEDIGRGRYLQFAALRRQPDGTWAIVEPSSDIVKRTLSRP